MAKDHIISITNGKGSKELDNGNYNVVSNIVGYDNSSITPSSLEITEDLTNYSFTIAATGTLTLHVTDDGTDIGIPVEGAIFYRCDSEGTTYGDAITSDSEGNAVFNFVPYADENAPLIYFKQTTSDGEHVFDDSLQNTSLTEETKIVEIANAMAASREFSITDANYADLPIGDGEITLSEIV